MRKQRMFDPKTVRLGRDPIGYVMHYKNAAAKARGGKPTVEVPLWGGCDARALHQARQDIKYKNKTPLAELLAGREAQA